LSLRARLIIAAVLVLVVVITSGLLFTRTVRNSQIGQIDQQLNAAVGITGISLPFDVPPEGPRRPPAPSDFSDVYLAQVVDGRRVRVIRSQLAAKLAPDLPTVISALGTHLSPTTVGSMSGSGSWRAMLVGTSKGHEVLLAIPLVHVDATTRRLMVAVGVGAAAVIVVMTAAGWWLMRLGLRPIAEVTDVADAISGGDRSRRVRETTSGTEASHLAHAFNVMLDEQQAIEQRLRRFLADASHELRTPVTAIGGFTDLWRQGALEEGQVSDVMRRIGQETARMRVLVQDMLLLAHLDEGRPLAREPVDLSSLAADAALDAKATHPSRRVEVEALGPNVVLGDETRLRQVVANLVSNALIHTGPEAMVWVSVERSEGVGVLTVTDDGQGMPAEQAARAFDRFWRANPSQGRHGAGLGLSIVRGIVEAHGGSVVLESAPGEGTKVRVMLPANGVSPGIGDSKALPSTLT
jgi:two-component system OmpR family sensor kinase